MTVVLNEMHVCGGLQCICMYITCITDIIRSTFKVPMMSALDTSQVTNQYYKDME